MKPIVSVAAVSKSYPAAGAATPVLENVNLRLMPGEKSSLIGVSGSGKSTLLSLIAGLLRPDEGAVAIDGIPMHELDDRARADLRARRIGIALQADNLIPFLSARENVEVALAFGTTPSGRAARERAHELLDRFGVAHRSDHRPRHLSGGEAQRVALAVSVANDPDLLLADEVVAQLDGATAAHVIDEVLAADYAVLYVTHDVALADRADHRYQLVDHRVESR